MNKELQNTFMTGLAMGYRLGQLVGDKYEEMKDQEPKEGEFVDPYMRAIKAAKEEMLAIYDDQLKTEQDILKGDIPALTDELLSSCYAHLEKCFNFITGNRRYDDEILSTILGLLGK